MLCGVMDVCLCTFHGQTQKGCVLYWCQSVIHRITLKVADAMLENHPSVFLMPCFLSAFNATPSQIFKIQSSFTREWCWFKQCDVNIFGINCTGVRDTLAAQAQVPSPWAIFTETENSLLHVNRFVRGWGNTAPPGKLSFTWYPALSPSASIQDPILCHSGWVVWHLQGAPPPQSNHANHKLCSEASAWCFFLWGVQRDPRQWHFSHLG